jgi:hypothetical protein
MVVKKYIYIYIYLFIIFFFQNKNINKQQKNTKTILTLITLEKINFFFLQTKKKKNHLPKYISKATAALMAAKFSSELSFFKVVLEGDTLQIVHALKKDGRYLSTHGHLIENTQVILNSLQN